MSVLRIRPTLSPEAMYERRWWALAVMCLSLLIISLDNTILNVAIPALENDLHASTSQLQWVIDGYTLVFAGLLLTTGSLGDRFGRRGALSTGLAIFGTGSLLSAFAGSATQLIFTRALMGVGAALIMPATLSLLTNVFSDPRERGRAIGAWAAVAGGSGIHRTGARRLPPRPLLVGVGVPDQRPGVHRGAGRRPLPAADVARSVGPPARPARRRPLGGRPGRPALEHHRSADQGLVELDA